MPLPTPGIDARVTLVDSTGAPISVGGGTQYQDGVTQAAPTGNVVEWLDTANVIRAVSAAKPLPVNVVSGAGSGLSVVDAASWTTAVSAFVPGGGVFNDSAAALTSGQQGTQRLTAQRAQHVNLRSTAGADLALTNDNAGPTALSYFGVLPSRAQAVSPSYTEGNLVLLSSNLSGQLRTVTQGYQAVGAAIAQNPLIMGGQFGGNAKLLSLDTNGGINQGSPNAGGALAWPVTLASTLNEANDSVTGHVGGFSKVATLTITRPANTTAYTAGDEIADVAGTAAQRTFAAARVNNGTGVVTGCSLIYSNNPAATPSLELYLFDTDPTSAGDNAAFAPTDAQLATSIGVITFPAPKVGTTGTSGNLIYDSGPVTIEFAATGGTTSLFGLLVTRIGFTPIANSETLTLRLRIEQN
jgi:hypothetical protein